MEEGNPFVDIKRLNIPRLPHMPRIPRGGASAVATLLVVAVVGFSTL